MECLVCKKAVGKWKQKYCSNECRDEHHRRELRETYHKTKVLWDRANRKCLRCGKEFTPEIGKHRYCSRDCAVNKKGEQNKRCVSCGEQYLGKASQHYCSRKCRLREFRKRRKSDSTYRVKQNKRKRARYQKDSDYRKRCIVRAMEVLKRSPVLRVRMSLRRRLKKLVTGRIRICALIGCSSKELRDRLEAQFRDGMNWENYGSHWVVDHVTPLAAFNLEDLVERGYACHFTNLQPLTVEENQVKADRFE